MSEAERDTVGHPFRERRRACVWPFIASGVLAGTSGCKGPVVVDHSVPEGPVAALFEAASAGDATAFRQLCSTRDGDVGLVAGNLCAVTPRSESWEGVRENYGACRVAGAAAQDADRALVPVTCPDAYAGGVRERTVGVIRRDGHWYLAPWVWHDPSDPDAVFGGPRQALAVWRRRWSSR